jgi:hypothetical protein
MAIETCGSSLYACIMVFIFMIKSSREMLHPFVNSFHSASLHFYRDYVSIIYILCTLLIICWVTPSLARISDNFLLSTLANILKVYRYFIVFYIKISLCFSIRIVVICEIENCLNIITVCHAGWRCNSFYCYLYLANLSNLDLKLLYCGTHGVLF